MTAEQSPVFHPSELKTDLLQDRLRELYNIKGRPQPLNGGIESGVWRIEGPQLLVAKVFGIQEGDREHIRDEVATYAFLNSHGNEFGIRAPQVIPTLSGETVSDISFDTLSYPLIMMVYEELRRFHPESITGAELSTIGNRIGSMHRLLKYSPQREYHESYPHWSKETQVDSAYKSIVSSPNGSVFDSRETSQLSELDSRLVNYSRDNSIPPTLSETLIHGDLSLEHAQLLPNGQTYFFDFADRAWGAIARELGTMLLSFSEEADIDYDRWLNMKQWLLDGYADTASLTTADLEAIPLFIIRKCLSEAKYKSEMAKNRGKPIGAEGIKQRFRLAQQVIERL